MREGEGFFEFAKSFKDSQSSRTYHSSNVFNPTQRFAVLSYLYIAVSRSLIHCFQGEGVNYTKSFFLEC